MAKNDKAQESAQKQVVMTYQQMNDFINVMASWSADKVDTGASTIDLGINLSMVKHYWEPFQKQLQEEVTKLRDTYEVIYFDPYPSGAVTLLTGQSTNCLCKKDGHSMGDILPPQTPPNPSLKLYTFENASKFVTEFVALYETKMQKSVAIIGATRIPSSELKELGKNKEVSAQQLGTLFPFMVED